MNRCVACVIAELRKPSIPMAPPIIQNIPKSDSPNAFNISRVEYNDTNMENAILVYKYPLFFKTLLIVLFDIGCL